MKPHSVPAANRLTRRATDLQAARVLRDNVNPIMAIVAQSIADVSAGQAVLAPCARDARLVYDIARRLDAAIPLPEPAETWDALVWALVAGIALAVYRAAQRAKDPAAHAALLVDSAVGTAEARHHAASIGSSPTE